MLARCAGGTGENAEAAGDLDMMRELGLEPETEAEAGATTAATEHAAAAIEAEAGATTAATEHATAATEAEAGATTLTTDAEAGATLASQHSGSDNKQQVYTYIYIYIRCGLNQRKQTILAPLSKDTKQQVLCVCVSFSLSLSLSNIYVCMYVCMYIYIYIYTYVYTYIHKKRARSLSVLARARFLSAQQMLGKQPGSGSCKVIYNLI
jgi:hypothetical protein